MLLLEMILPRRDEINEHLVDIGSGVNIHAPRIGSSIAEEGTVHPFVSLLSREKGWVSSFGMQKVLMTLIEILKISHG